MPRYEITSPDGDKYEITAPEGASDADVLAYAQANFKKPEPAGLASLIPSSLNRGAAALVDSVVDAPNKLANMGRAAIGAGLYATGNTGAQDFADKYGFTTMVDDPSLVGRLLDATGTGQVRPVTPLEKRIDWMAQAAPATMLSPRKERPMSQKLPE